MAVTLEAESGNYLSDRKVKRLFDEVSDGIFREFRKLPAPQGRELLDQVGRALEQEISADERFQNEFDLLREELLRVATPDELARLHKGMVGLVTGFFSRRESVPALHALCTMLLDTTVSQALRLAEEELADAGGGVTPRYAWLVLGAAGRREATISMELESLLVHGPGPDAAWYCARLAARGAAILEQCGFRKSRRGITPDDPAWRASLEEWEERFEELCRRSSGSSSPTARSGLRDLFAQRTTTLSTPLFQLADLRVVSGDPELGGNLVLLVRAAARRHPACILEAARSVTALPSPFNFFGNYRVERSGAHRGRVDLNRWGCFPLVSMVRLQAVIGGVVETGTLERIQLLLGKGTLDVALGKRLLQGGIENFRLKARLEAREDTGEEDGAWLLPESLPSDDERALREALDSFSTLQKVIHSSLAQQG